MTGREALRFRTFGFLQCRQMLSSREMGALSTAFDAAMERAGRHRPTPSGDRRQVVPFFDYDPDAFYPLLDDERLLGVFETLLGEDFILVATEGIIHAGGSPWHRDACAPEGMFSMRAAIYLDPLGPDDGCLSVIPAAISLRSARPWRRPPISWDWLPRSCRDGIRSSTSRAT